MRRSTRGLGRFGRHRAGQIALALVVISGTLVTFGDADAQTIQSIDIRVAAAGDDVEEQPGYLYTSSTDLELTADGSTTQLIGLRFTDVSIPAGAEITAAWIEFTVDEVSQGSAQLSVHGVAEADAPAFSGSDGVSSRSTTTTAVAWAPEPWLEIGSAQSTPDLTQILSDLTSSQGWQPGNALAFTITGTGTRVAESFEGFPGGAPLLHVDFTVDPVTNLPPEVSATSSDPDPSGSATLTGSVTDDGLPAPPSLTLLWTQSAGPAAVIDDPSALETAVTLSDPGTYVFSLEANDGALVGSDATVVSLGAGVGSDPLLPDLISVATDVGRQKFTIGDSTFPQLDGRLLLRFDGYVANAGDGPLHVTGNPQHLDPADLNSHDVWQWVEQTDGTLVPARKVPIKYETDDDHNHFHFMELIEYELLVGDGSSGETAVSGRKVGFCLVDGEPIPGYPNPGPQTYVSALTDRCGQDDPTATELVMGVTEGWQDVYGWDTNFQWFDVSDVVPGQYRIRSTADPSDLVIELDEVNPPVLAPEISVIPGFAPIDIDATTAAAAPVSIVLDSTRHDSAQLDAPIVATPVYSIESLPTGGQLDVAVGPLGSPAVQYTPAPGFSGVDSFTFGVRNTASQFPLTTPIAQVTITVDGTTTNSPPQVEATAVPGASPSDPIGLSAQVTDDGLPDPPAATTWEWAQTSGPTATIANSERLITAATPSGAGIYVFTGTAHDGQFSASATVQVEIGGTNTDSGAYPITSSADDVEELPGGELYSDSSDLELSEDWSNQTIGLRFTDVTVPAGATVESAWVQFTTDEVSTAAASLTISAEAAGSGPYFGSGAVTSRTLTTETVAWIPAPWPTLGDSGPAQRTPDLASVVAEVVASPGWQPGSALGIVITGSGTRIAESYDGAPTAAPVLHVQWSSAPPGTNTAPRLSATGTGGPVGSDANLVASVADDGLPNPPGSTTITWEQTGGPASSIADPSAPTTTATLPEPGDYTFDVTAFDGELAVTETVIVTAFDPATTPQTLTATIVSGTDDVEELSSGYLYVGSSDLEMAEELGSPQLVGLRFAEVALPGGATVISAHIQFTADEADSEATTLSIDIIDSVDTEPFSGRGALSTALLLADSVPWAPGGWPVVGASDAGQATPELAGLVTAITSRPEWSAGNSLAFVVSGSGARVAEAFEGDSAAAPRLVIEYLPPG